MTRCVLVRHFGPIDYFSDIVNLILFERNCLVDYAQYFDYEQITEA